MIFLTAELVAKTIVKITKANTTVLSRIFGEDC